MPTPGELGASLSQSDLELAYLKTIGATGPTLADARFQIRGENDHAYFAALSGLTPKVSYSLADHMYAYYFGQVGGPGSLADLARKFWISKIISVIPGVGYGHGPYGHTAYGH